MKSQGTFELDQLSDPDTLSELLSSQAIIALLGRQDYRDTLAAMQRYTLHRGDYSPDQIWLVEHPPIFTQGKSSQPGEIIHNLSAPLIHTDRGGKITYHGPGQLVAYFLINLRKNKTFGLRHLVDALEDIVKETLAFYGIKSYNSIENRGVYCEGNKIASLGLRVKNHCSYHGFALNVYMDLQPFSDIKPCGLPQKMTQISEHTDNTNNIVTVCVEKVQLVLKSLAPFTLIKCTHNQGEEYDDSRKIAW